MKYRTVWLAAISCLMAACGTFGGNAEVGSEPGSALGPADGLDPAADAELGPPVVGGGNVLNLGGTAFCATAVANASAANQTLQLAHCVGSARQLWGWSGRNLQLADGRCLMAPAAAIKTNYAVALPCAKVSDAQGLWRFDGAQLVLQADPTRCLQGGTGAGTPLVVAPCAEADADARLAWGLIDVGDVVEPTKNPNAASPTGDDEPATGGGNGPTTPTQDPNGGDGTGSPVAGTLALPTDTNDTSALGGARRSYSGPATNFPNDPSRWESWDSYWARASAQFPQNNTAAQSGWIKDGILAEAKVTGMDPRFILAVVMQESGGDVHVRTTNNGVRNPGLMQSHNGATFTDNGDGGKASILLMIKDGVEGTASGDGLIQGVRQTKNYFAAGRLYNSGTLDPKNLSNGLGATASYCSDLANRVMGRM